MKPITNEGEQEMYSLNELLAINRAKHPNRPKWLFGLHMAFSLSFRIIRHSDIRTLLLFWLMLTYKAYTQYKAAFISLMIFIAYWIAMHFKAGVIAGCVTLILYWVYKSLKQFGKDIGV